MHNTQLPITSRYTHSCFLRSASHLLLEPRYAAVQRIDHDGFLAVARVGHGGDEIRDADFGRLGLEFGLGQLLASHHPMA